MLVLEQFQQWLANYIPSWLAYIIPAFIGIVILIIFVILMVMLFVYLERRVVGRFQIRLGPNRAGPQGILQPVADVVKLLFKEDIIPARGDRWIHLLAPIIAMFPAFMIFAVIPWGSTAIFADLNIGILYVIAISSLGAVGVFMAGWGSSNKYSLVSAMRTIAQVVSYEIPLVLSLVGVLIITGSLSMVSIVEAQTIPFFLLQPLGFLIFFIAAAAEIQRSPFDLLEAESEIVTGYHTEYSGLKFALFFLGEYTHIFALSAIVATIFLGGWTGPLLPGPLWFLIKVLAVFFILLWMRSTLPRLRVDQLMGFAWKFLFPLAVINLFITGAEVIVWPNFPWPLIFLNIAIAAVLIILWSGFFKVKGEGVSFKHFGRGIAKGMAVTGEHLFRHTITVQYPEQRLTVSKRARGNWFIRDDRKRAPCSLACPAGVDAQGYVALISQGKFKEALELVRQKIPFPGIIGRVCPHPCEEACNRGLLDEPISIRDLKRFVADYEMSVGADEIAPAPRTRDERVAIIGSGPGGLTAAHDLVKMGYGVTVFEALPVPGGMMAVGIPEYRLPRDIIQKEIEDIQKLGVDLKLNSQVGKDGLTLEALRKQGYKAILMAVGAHSSMKLDIPGEELEGVYHGVSFLRDVSLGKEVWVGERVSIVGGGNVAIDAARTALRFGAKEVVIVYRRSRQEMPASDEEIEDAEHEGVKIHYLAAPVRVLGEQGKVTGLECIRMELGEPDDSGRRRPIPVEGSEFVLDIDMLVPAIGQTPDLSFLPEDHTFSITRRGTFEVDSVSLATNIPSVFACGDTVSGPATVVEAIGAGSRAARAIDCYLRGEELGLAEELLPLKSVAFEDMDTSDVVSKGRQHMPYISVEERGRGFKEVYLGFSEEAAVEEASRCLNCGVCAWCRLCERACPYGVIKITPNGTEANSLGVARFDIDLGKCIFCGLCIEACPAHRLYLERIYEAATYCRGDLALDKEALIASPSKQPSSYARPELEPGLPKQSLLLYRGKEGE